MRLRISLSYLSLSCTDNAFSPWLPFKCYISLTRSAMWFSYSWYRLLTSTSRVYRTDSSYWWNCETKAFSSSSFAFMYSCDLNPYCLKTTFLFYKSDNSLSPLSQNWARYWFLAVRSAIILCSSSLSIVYLFNCDGLLVFMHFLNSSLSFWMLANVNCETCSYLYLCSRILLTLSISWSFCWWVTSNSLYLTMRSDIFS